MLASVLGWTFLPNFAANTLLQLYYSSRHSPQSPSPPPGSPQYRRDRRIAYIVVISLYILYTFYSVLTSLAPNYYNLFGLHNTPDLDSRLLRSIFRRLSLQFHPDKLTSPAISDHNFYININHAYQVLADPVKRQAYNRLGPNFLSHYRPHTASRQHSYLVDYTLSALSALLLRYVMILVGLVCTQMAGYAVHGAYWRYLAVALMFMAESHLLVSHNLSPLLSTLPQRLLPSLTPYELVHVLNEFLVCIFVGVSQIGPTLMDLWAAEDMPGSKFRHHFYGNRSAAIDPATRAKALMDINASLAGKARIVCNVAKISKSLAKKQQQQQQQQQQGH
ncbi:hypothetical protein EV182_005920 [Spiromyces aspiralis]|uniref:Uncharacterized protein n=1 Tax=Spiromyces aspiralis TaxID=68401 RepID=A0ACC1H9C9_9FUNG|nr:hypothetical protein EV182_005920 [Spiromyces aspiralis]